MNTQYCTCDSETGTVIDCFVTEDEALEAIENYEEIDRTEGNYVPNFYSVTRK